MNESILKALMRLFAIIANVNSEGASPRARAIVESYLKLQLNQEVAETYIKLFDDYLFHHHKDTNTSERIAKKRTSLNSVKVLMICHEINEELQQREKIIVLLRLLEFVSEDVLITEKELDFITTVANTFNIPHEEYSDIKDFVIGNVKNISNFDNYILIENFIENNSDNNNDNDLYYASNNNQNYKVLHEKHLDGQIKLLFIKSSNLIIFSYSGEDVLYLNNQNIIPAKNYLLDHGALIKGAKISPVYHSDILSKFIYSDKKAKIVLTAENIVFKFQGSENGIKKFSFSEESGHLLGIMGGSGVGKSTLLNLLIGNYNLNEGKILINGFDLTENKNELKGVIGYVPQDDLLIEELTVFQNLYYNAKLCFKGFSKKQIIKSVAKILIDLDLNDIHDLKVGDPLNKFISGGQRKRLNIALELIRKPSILVVDEPTSGLSSSDSEMVMSLLKEQALNGKLVIVNIHQPSSSIFKLFDKLLILDRGGYPIYLGNPIDALVYFKTMSNHANAEESECYVCGNVNPENILELIEAKVVNEYGKLTRNRKISPHQWYNLFNEHINPKNEIKNSDKKIPLPENNFKIPNGITQFGIFSIRNILTKLTNKQYLLINFLEAPILAIILGYFTKYISGNDINPDAYVFAKNVNISAYLFMCVIVSLFMGLTVSAEEIIRDRKIIKREKFLNLSKLSYLHSKILVLFLLSSIQTISFILVGNYILEIKGLTLQYWLILFSTSALANLIGLNISAAMNSVVNIYITIPLFLVPQILFSGTVVDFSKLNKNFTSAKYVPVIGDLMTSRWAYEALAVVQFKDNEYEKHFFEIEKKISNATVKSMYLIPQLQTKVDNCLKNRKLKQNEEQTEKDLIILKNEVKELISKSGIKFELVDKINNENFNDDVGVKTNIYLSDLVSFYENVRTESNNVRDGIYNNLVKELGSQEAVFELKQNYHNERIEEVLTGKSELDMIKEGKDFLLQKKDAVYMSPLSHFGRAHFYASYKKIFGYEIDTFIFNVVFIWLTCITLYITLITDTLKKIIYSLSKIKIFRRLRKL